MQPGKHLINDTSALASGTSGSRLRPHQWSALRVSLVALLALIAGCANFARPDPPHITLANLRLTDIGLFEQRYGLQLRVQNPNDIELPIAGMEFRLILNNIEFGRGVSRQAVTVPAYGEALLNVDVVSNLSRVVEQLKELEIGRGARMRYELTGGMSLANRRGKIPFAYTGEIGADAKRE